MSWLKDEEQNPNQIHYRWDSLKLRLREGKGVEAFPWVKKRKIRGRAKKKFAQEHCSDDSIKPPFMEYANSWSEREPTHHVTSEPTWIHSGDLWHRSTWPSIPSGLPPLPTVENIRQRQTRIRQTALPYIHVSLWDFLVPSFVSQCSCKTTTNYCFYLNRGLDVSGLVIYSPDVVLKGSWCTEFFFSFCREIGVSVLNHSPAPVKYRRQKGHDDVRTTVWCTHGSFWLIVNRTDIKKKKKPLSNIEGCN